MDFNNFGTFLGYLKHEVKQGEQYHIGVDFSSGRTESDGSISHCARTYTVTDSLSQIIATHKVRNIIYDDWREQEEDMNQPHIEGVFNELRPYFQEKDLELITHGGKFWLERVDLD